MPATAYKKPPKKQKADPKGRAQHKSSPKGVLHTDFAVEYARDEPPADLFKQQFRVLARANGNTYDISKVCEQVTWSDDSANDLLYVNAQPSMQGTIQLRKPALSQYKQLLPAFFDATPVNGTSRWGAIGVVIVLEVGFGKHFVPLWAMRVTPGQGTQAEQVTVSDGEWALTLADDLTLLGESVDDFKFTKGKTTRKKGWRCDEITAEVARLYSVPVKQLAKGTAYFDLPTKTTSAVSPLTVIANAYQEETNRTGKAFIVRWAAPDKKWPLGALEVVPMRRNPNLLKFRRQLTEAVLTRSQSTDFATVVEGRATLKHGSTTSKKKGASKAGKQLKFVATNEQAVRRFGYVHKIIDFNPVSSALELQIMSKRALAARLVPLRTAELTHPGVATLRRGDAIRLDLPEEGYAPLALNADQTPSGKKSKQTALALRLAETADPSLFGLPDSSALFPSGTTTTQLKHALTADVAVRVPVADQGIAFVTTITHTVTATSYSMDFLTSFVDILDPVSLQAEIAANIRAAKSLKRTTKTTSGGRSGPRWHVTASAEDDPPGAPGACRPIQTDGYSELSTVPMGTGSDFAALGNLSCLTALKITNPANGRSVTTVKQDKGAGSSFLPVMGIYPGTRTALGLDNSGEYHVIIERADGGSLRPVRGTPA